MSLEHATTIVVPDCYAHRLIAVMRQGMAILGKPRGVKYGAEADELMRLWCDAQERRIKAEQPPPVR